MCPPKPYYFALQHALENKYNDRPSVEHPQIVYFILIAKVYGFAIAKRKKQYISLSLEIFDVHVMGFMMGRGIVILVKIEIDYKIFREIAILFSSSIERLIGNSFVGSRPIIFMLVSSATGMCSVYATVSNLIK